MRSALAAPELASKHSAVGRHADRMSQVMNEWSQCCLVFRVGCCGFESLGCAWEARKPDLGKPLTSAAEG